MDERQWWHHAVVYQIYPRSFADSDGDGLGDLRGITSRVDHLSSLGVDAVWLSPFYPSALADGGYDVDDYRDVDPRLGTLADLDRMITVLHERGIKVMVDIVPNHTSDRHAWFREALASPPGSPARDRYVFRDGKGPDGAEPPSDWESVFGGPAWTRTADGQWYLHLFAEQQPDLNWKNPDVRAEFRDVLRFWSDRGVDGFRVDVAHGLAKDLSEPFVPQAKLPAREMSGGTHPLWDRDEVHEIYAEWRAVFDTYDPPRIAVAEAWVHPSRRSRYASPAGLGQAFNFDLLDAGWSCEQFRDAIVFNLADAQRVGTSSTWVLSNHDVVRQASRYGLLITPDEVRHGRELSRAWLRSGGTAPPLDRALGERRARAALLLVLALPGSTYLYQGEELGLHEVADLPDERRQDPVFYRTGRVEKGRDGCRVPLPWTSSGPSFGFGTDGAHLPQPDWFARYAADVQDADPDSTLSLYRRAIALRRKLYRCDEVQLIEDVPGVLHVRRGDGWHSVTNFGPAPAPLPDGELVLTSVPLEDGLLPPDASAWLSMRTDDTD